MFHLDKVPRVRFGSYSVCNNPLFHYGTKLETLPDSGIDSVLQNQNTKQRDSVNYLLLCGLGSSSDFTWDQSAACIIQQDRKCKPNVTLRRVRANIVVVEKQ